MAKRRWAVIATSIALAVGPALTYADPGNGKGQGHGKDKGQHGQGHGGSYGGPSINRGDVLGILDGHRGYWSAGPALPPAFRRTWPVANRCRQVSPRSWMAGCWGNSLIMMAMSGCRRGRT